MQLRFVRYVVQVISFCVQFPERFTVSGMLIAYYNLFHESHLGTEINP